LTVVDAVLDLAVSVGGEGARTERARTRRYPETTEIMPSGRVRDRRVVAAYSVTVTWMSSGSSSSSWWSLIPAATASAVVTAHARSRDVGMHAAVRRASPTTSRRGRRRLVGAGRWM
jgi:hypothetical protein